MRVRIYKPAKSAAQSGRSRGHEWLIEPEIMTPRVPEPVMGWVSASDTMSELKGKLKFATKDEAVAFAKTKGWECVIEEPAERRIIPRNYLDNFRSTRPQDEERASKAN